MNRTGWLTLGALVAAAILGCVLAIAYLADDLAWWGATLGVIGALLFGSLGTYTDLDTKGRPREKPAGIRELLLGDGRKKVKTLSWGAYVVLRVLASATLVAGFVTAVLSAVDTQRQANTLNDEIMQLRRENRCLREAQISPGANTRQAFAACVAESPMGKAEEQ